MIITTTEKAKFLEKKEHKNKNKKEDPRGTGDGNHTNYEGRRKIKSVPYVWDRNQNTRIAQEKTNFRRFSTCSTNVTFMFNVCVKYMRIWIDKYE